MALSSLVARSTYPGDDTTGPFDYGFKIYASTDLQVVLVDDETGAETPLSYPAHYTVTGAGKASGGTITLASAVATGTTLVIRRKMPLTQPVDIANQGAGPAFPASIEAALDRGMMVAQQVQDILDRTVRTAVTDEVLLTLPTATQRAGKFLAFDMTGQPTATIGELTGVPVSSFMEPVVQATSGTGALDALTWTANGEGAVARPVSDILNDTVRLLDYNPPLDGVSDATAAFEAAAAAAAANGGGMVEVPPLRFLTNYVHALPNVGFVVRQAGLRINSTTASIGAYDPEEYAFQVGDGSTSVTGVVLQGLTFHGNNTQKYGLRFYGCSRCHVVGLGVNGFTRVGVSVTNSASQSTFYNYITNYTIHTGVDAEAVGLDVVYNNTGGQFTTALFLAQGNIESTASSTSHRAVRADGAMTIRFATTWVECGDETGLESLNGAVIDGGGSSFVDAGSDSNNIGAEADADVLPSQRFPGWVIDGKMKTPAGNSPITLSGGRHIPSGAFIKSPFLQGQLFFTNASLNNYAQTDYSDQTVYLQRIGAQLRFISGGGWQFNAQTALSHPITLAGTPGNAQTGIKLGDAGAYATIGTDYAFGNPYLAANARQTTYNTDEWALNSSGTVGLKLHLDYTNHGLILQRAASGSSAAAAASFWTTLFKAHWITGGSVFLEGNAEAGGAVALITQRAGVARWAIGDNNDAESSGNAGSNFVINARADDGSAIGTALLIRRSDMRATFAGDIQKVGTNGQDTQLKQATTTVNASAGSTITATNLIPAGALVLGVTSRVTTTFGNSSGLTSISIGDGTTADLFSANTGITAGTTTGIANWKSGTDIKLYRSATSVVLTSAGGDFDSDGVIRLTVHYLTLTPSSS